MKREMAIDATLTLLRVASGLLFFQAGAMKVLGWYGGLPREMFPAGIAPMYTQTWLAGMLELFGGALILLGFLTRPTGFLLSGEMAVAYFLAHQPKGTWPVQNHGEAAVLFCFIFLMFAAVGAGKFSLDFVLLDKERKTRDQGHLSRPDGSTQL